MSLDFSFRCTFLGNTVSASNTATTTDPHVTDSGNVVVANGQTNKEVVLAIDFSQLKAIFISSDRAVLIETNDGTTPDDTITLAANVPYIWQVGSASACLITEDVTKVFVTNASGADANLRFRVLQDATP
jgi:hypothetical protein